jgi:predicted Zn finger-like uncharacterized protein
MIISCPSCQAQFRLGSARLGPEGKKVRCSKCGHVWHAVPEMSPGPGGQPGEAAVAPENSGPEEAGAAVQSPLTARDPEDMGGEAAVSKDDDADNGLDIGADGLTDGQRAALAAARNKKHPRGARFWIYVLLVFIVVVGLLYLAQNMGLVPSSGPKKAGPAIEQPANVAPVDAKPAPAISDSDQVGGHIVGGATEAEPEKPAQ